jgi:hypothetical protein
MSGVAATGLALNTVAELNNINDAKALGIDEDYDSTNNTLVFYHISEFFRMAPGAKLFIMLVSQATTLTQIADKTTTNGLAKLLRDPLCKGKVRQAGIARNPASGYTPTLAAGIDSDCLAVSGGTYSGAVVKAQALAADERTYKRPVHVFVEARLDPAMATASLIDATGADCNHVQLVALQDKAVGDAHALYAAHAAVGTVLGLRAKIGISESLAHPGEGSPGAGNIQSAAESKFITPALSSNDALSTYTDIASGDQDVIYDKGFLAPRVYQGYPGVYVNSDRTCTATSSDYARGALNMVVNEWERIVYKVMVPKIEASVKVDKNTGYLDPLVTKAWEADVDAAVSKEMVGVENDAAADISGAETYINPQQNVLSTDTITVEGSIVPKGYAKTIAVKIGLDNPYSA